MRRTENEPTSTRSQASRSSRKAASASTAPSDLRSMLNRTSGKASKSVASVGTGSEPPMSACSTSAQVASATLPVRSVTRSSTVSWKASRTPSRVTCTSVSR